MVQGYQQIDFVNQPLVLLVLALHLLEVFHGPQQPGFLVPHQDDFPVGSLADKFTDHKILGYPSGRDFGDKEACADLYVHVLALPERGDAVAAFVFL